DAEVLARHAGLATAVRAAWDDAVGRLASHPGSTVAALAAREAIAAEEMTILLTEVELLTWQEQASQFDDGSVEATCRHAAQILFELGLLPGVASAEGCASTGAD
ncbi:MAG: hypothetical protein GY720_12205, partial [bacterium]|nr:hypothetical protein [bacterium]